jgi:hypothetical protein
MAQSVRVLEKTESKADPGAHPTERMIHDRMRQDRILSRAADLQAGLEPAEWAWRLDPSPEARA